MVDDVSKRLGTVDDISKKLEKVDETLSEMSGAVKIKKKGLFR
jgi:hypothetical protein